MAHSASAQAQAAEVQLEHNEVMQLMEQQNKELRR
jgi:hypothetical protein